MKIFNALEISFTNILASILQDLDKIEWNYDTAVIALTMLLGILSIIISAKKNAPGLLYAIYAITMITVITIAVCDYQKNREEKLEKIDRETKYEQANRVLKLQLDSMETRIKQLTDTSTQTIIETMNAIDEFSAYRDDKVEEIGFEINLSSTSSPERKNGKVHNNLFGVNKTGTAILFINTLKGYVNFNCAAGPGQTINFERFDDEHDASNPYYDIVFSDTIAGSQNGTINFSYQIKAKYDTIKNMQFKAGDLFKQLTESTPILEMELADVSPATGMRIARQINDYCKNAIVYARLNGDMDKILIASFVPTAVYLQESHIVNVIWTIIENPRVINDNHYHNGHLPDKLHYAASRNFSQNSITY